MTDSQPIVDINHASIDDLTTINGIGQKLAEKIVDNRPYKALLDLVHIPGINETKLASLTPYMKIGDSSNREKSLQKRTAKLTEGEKHPIATLGETEAFVFLEDRNQRQDALLIIFGGFILGLIILVLRRARN